MHLLSKIKFVYLPNMLRHFVAWKNRIIHIQQFSCIMLWFLFFFSFIVPIVFIITKVDNIKLKIAGRSCNVFHLKIFQWKIRLRLLEILGIKNIISFHGLSCRHDTNIVAHTNVEHCCRNVGFVVVIFLAEIY